MSTPTVSVALAVYNGGPYLKASIDSVLSQTMTDFELVICDDGSTDGSTELINNYRDQRVQVLQNPRNLGLFPTLNRIINSSQGKYIHLWSADDVMKPNCLLRQVQLQEKYPQVGMSYCQYDIIDAEGRLVRPARADRTPEVVSPSLAAQIMYYYNSIAGNIANVMLRRSALDQVGLFREDMRQVGDVDMWVRISANAPIGFVREPLIYLRNHQRQLSKRDDAHLRWIVEERDIVRELRRRLPADIVRHADDYNRRNRYRLHVHGMLRCLALGQFGLAADMFRAIASVENIWILLALWALTLDGRVFTSTPVILDPEWVT